MPWIESKAQSVNRSYQGNSLNLIGVISPVCLLECKSVLAEMAVGAELEVLLRDPEVVETLVKIIERSHDRLVQCDWQGDHFRIILKKGEILGGET
jgi:TusA-related sulfurtransferase